MRREKGTAVLRAAVTVLCPVIFLVGSAALAQQTNTNAAIGKEDQIQPQELAKLLKSGSEKPLVLYVGFHVLYHGGHIPGAEFIGAASQEAGKNDLIKRVQPLPRSTFVVVYCGCCPWTHCPNVKPALAQLRSMGFTKAKVLYLENNFRSDWVDKGYPVESGD